MLNENDINAFVAQRTKISLSKMLGILAIIFLALTIIGFAFYGLTGLIPLVFLLIILAILIPVQIFKEIKEMGTAKNSHLHQPCAHRGSMQFVKSGIPRLRRAGSLMLTES